MALPIYPKRYYAAVKDPKMAPLLLIHIYEGSVSGNCAVCGKEILYNDKTMHPIQSVACNFQEATKIPGVYKPELVDLPKHVIVDDDNDLPEDENDENPVESIPQPVVDHEIKKERGSCSICGGPPARRGYQHKDDCTESTAYKLSKIRERSAVSRSKDPCPVCGGPPGRARGFQHKLGCTESTAYKLAAQQKARQENVAKCDKCGGPRRGLGFMHEDNCEFKTNTKKLVEQD